MSMKIIYWYHNKLWFWVQTKGLCWWSNHKIGSSIFSSHVNSLLSQHLCNLLSENTFHQSVPVKARTTPATLTTITLTTTSNNGQAATRPQMRQSWAKDRLLLIVPATWSSVVSDVGNKLGSRIGCRLPSRRFSCQALMWSALVQDRSKSRETALGVRDAVKSCLVGVHFDREWSAST